MSSITVGGRTFEVLFPDEFDPLTGEARAEMKESIRAKGVDRPVLVTPTFGVIDGINRLQLAAELGLKEVPLEVRSVATLEEARELCLTCNLHRRHLTPEQQRRKREERRAKIQAMEQGESKRKIAKEVGVSKSQVHRISSGVPQGTPEEKPKQEAPKVSGQDGKRYPGRKFTPAQQQALKEQTVLLRNKGQRIDDIAAAIGCSTGKVSEIIRDAKKDGLLKEPRRKAKAGGDEEARAALERWREAAKAQTPAPQDDERRQRLKTALVAIRRVAEQHKEFREARLVMASVERAAKQHQLSLSESA